MPHSARVPGYAGHLPGLFSEPLIGRSFAYLTAYRENLIEKRAHIWTTEYKDRHHPIPNLLYTKKSLKMGGNPKLVPPLTSGNANEGSRSSLNPANADYFALSDQGNTSPASGNTQRSNWGSAPDYAYPAPAERREGPPTQDLYAVERTHGTAQADTARRICKRCEPARRAPTACIVVQHFRTCALLGPTSYGARGEPARSLALLSLAFSPSLFLPRLLPPNASRSSLCV